MIFEEMLREEKQEGRLEGRIEGRIEATREAILELGRFGRDFGKTSGQDCRPGNVGRLKGAAQTCCQSGFFTGL